MILSDMDGVLATGEGGDTAPGKPIYRTFLDPPPELNHIVRSGIQVHVVTAKVEAEARQVLRAIGMDEHLTSVVGADRLFWPTLWKSVRRRRFPNAVSKSACRRFLPEPGSSRVVMIEDHLPHVVEMLQTGAADFGVLVPSIRIRNDRVEGWFDLDRVFRIARTLSAGEELRSDPLMKDLLLYRLQERSLEEVSGPWTIRAGEAHGLVLRLPDAQGGGPASSGRLETGQVFEAGRGSAVRFARAARRAMRRAVGRSTG